MKIRVFVAIKSVDRGLCALSDSKISHRICSLFSILSCVTVLVLTYCTVLSFTIGTIISQTGALGMGFSYRLRTKRGGNSNKHPFPEQDSNLRFPGLRERPYKWLYKRHYGQTVCIQKKAISEEDVYVYRNCQVNTLNSVNVGWEKER